MDDLVRRLIEGKHAVEVRVRPEKTPAMFKAAIDRGIVHLRFPETRGGTELGVHLDPGSSDLSGADFERGTGSVKLNGRLTLNYVKVRCIADINLDSLTGLGNLELAS